MNNSLNRVLQKRKVEEKKTKIYAENLQMHLSNLIRTFQRRWFIVTSEGVGYIKEKDFFDQKLREFCFYKNFLQLKFLRANRFNIIFEVREFQMRFKRQEQMLDFLYALVYSFDHNSFKEKYRFGSFSPVFQNNRAIFYINGFTEPNYFNDLHDAILQAKRSIIITDWWLSPEIYLKRPIQMYPDSQLYKVLGVAAQKGVKVFVLLYRESPTVLPNDSAHSQKLLMDQSDNIIVVRHPYEFINFWSHHEKMVVIDNKKLFMGGLDLCFGRYEGLHYPLTDMNQNQTMFFGQDYSNPRIKDFVNVAQFEKTLIDKNTQPRMPWRDQAIQVTGPVVKQLTNHFRQYWEFANLQNDKKQSIDQQILNKELAKVDEELKNFRQQYGNNQHLDSSAYKRYENQMDDVKRSLQKQLLEAVKKRFSVDQTAQTRELIPIRKLEEDKKVKLRKKFTNALKRDKRQERNNLTDKFNEGYGKLLDFFDIDHQSSDDDIAEEEISEYRVSKDDFKQSTLIIQALRSASYWSIGLHNTKPEKSIMEAYEDLITNSKRFIYIENQFFVSSTSGAKVKNQLIDLVAKRVIKAIDERQPFVVFIFIPLLPGFYGNIAEKDGDVLRMQVDLCLKTLSQGENSLIKQVQKHYNNWRKYIKVFGLRNHAMMQNGPVTEMVYIHSKLMIVDDCRMIIGSANINDRSQLGTRDSELALIIEDEQHMEIGTLAGQPFKRSKMITYHRMNCMLSIFQLNIKYEDVLHPVFLEAIEKQAEINDNFYFNVFKTYPHNNLKSLDDIRKETYKHAVDTNLYEQEKDKVVGFAVHWPYQFLEKAPNFLQDFHSISNTIAPMRIFT